MADTAPPQSTALALPEKAPAIVRIVNDVLDIAANLLHDRNKGRRDDMGARREMINKHLVMSLSSPGSAFIAHVAFGGENRRVGSTIVQRVVRGVLQFDKDVKPLMDFTPEYDLAITGTCELPDPKDGTKRVERKVQPLVLCDGRGGLVPYVIVDPKSGQLRAGPRMLCLFIRDFDSRSGKENGRIRAVPLGLASSANIKRYNDIIARLTSQGSSNAWEMIAEIGNNIGRAARFLLLSPQGVLANRGLTPVWKDWNFDDLDPERNDFWIVARLGGKSATLARKSQPIILGDVCALEQIFRVNEGWNSVELYVWGLPGEIGEMELHELEQGSMIVDWLALFGASLYTVTPNSGAGLLRTALQHPPLDEMVAVGLLPPGGSRDMAVTTLRGFAMKIRSDIESTVRQALELLVNNLGPGGLENPTLSLADALGGEPTPELLETVLERGPTGDDLLMIAILTSQTAGGLLLEIFDPNCWLTTKAWRILLLTMAKQAGIELPPEPVVEPEPPATPPVESSPPEVAPGEQPPASADAAMPPNGTAGSAIVWRPDMGRGELYKLAKSLEGVTSRTTKPQLVAALQAVCPPTPPAVEPSST